MCFDREHTAPLTSLDSCVPPAVQGHSFPPVVLCVDKSSDTKDAGDSPKRRRRHLTPELHRSYERNLPGGGELPQTPFSCSHHSEFPSLRRGHATRPPTWMTREINPGSENIINE